MIRVLVVEDSAVVREFLVHLLSADPALEVIETATNGEDALEAVKRCQPDVVTMDINMPKVDGFEATRRIMETHPTPIVIVSGSWDPREVATTFRVMEAGALAVVPRPAGIGHPDHEAMVKELVQTVKLMSEVKVVRRWARPRREAAVSAAPPALDGSPGRSAAQIKLVAIGASTGGPLVLQRILSGLAKDFPVPVVVVQHIAAGFIAGFADWLAQSSGFPVRVAADGEGLLPGHVYVAPDGFHMEVGPGHRIALNDDEPDNGLRPSVARLFHSVADSYGPSAVGVLLTGMGKDGAEALKRMKDRGAITVAQDKDSSVVHGMPGEAIRLGAATHVLSPEQMAQALGRWVDRR